MAIKNARELVLALCKDEAGRTQINVANMTEAVARISDLCLRDKGVLGVLAANGHARIMKKLRILAKKRHRDQR